MKKNITSYIQKKTNFQKKIIKMQFTQGVTIGVLSLLLVVPIIEGSGIPYVHKGAHNEILKQKTEITKTYPFYDNQFKEGGKRILADILRVIRIEIDYTKLDEFILANPVNSAVSVISKRVLTNTQKYFQSFIKVTSPDSMAMSTTPETCGGVEFVGKASLAADLYVIINPESDSTKTYFAAAAYGAADGNTGRPTGGIYFLNFATMKSTPLEEYYFFTTFTHEFMHILYFSKPLFEQYRKSDNTPYLASAIGTLSIGGKTYETITIPEVITYAKEYYGGNTITGLPLENDGGTGTAGSHWEKLFFAEEIMNPTIEYPAKISKFNIILMKASRWYTIDTESISDYTWGKGSGCIFSDGKTCPSTVEYGSSDDYAEKDTIDRGSADFLSKSYCNFMTTFVGDGGFKRKSQNYGLLNIRPETASDEEFYGIHSRCIEWKEDNGGTYPVGLSSKCENGKILIGLASKKVTKTGSKAGEKLYINDSIYISCPDPAVFGGYQSKNGPLDGSGLNGFGMSSKGFGFSNFSGDDGSVCADPNIGNGTPYKDQFLGNIITNDVEMSLFQFSLSLQIIFFGISLVLF